MFCRSGFSVMPPARMMLDSGPDEYANLNPFFIAS
jgi:hypothetical protein